MIKSARAKHFFDQTLCGAVLHILKLINLADKEIGKPSKPMLIGYEPSYMADLIESLLVNLKY